jgi:hypothetical protein
MTDAEGQKFYYLCPKCRKPIYGCPDPACMEDGVGHHTEDDDCDDDVPYATCVRIYGGEQ